MVCEPSTKSKCLRIYKTTPEGGRNTGSRSLGERGSRSLHLRRHGLWQRDGAGAPLLVKEISTGGSFKVCEIWTKKNTSFGQQKNVKMIGNFEDQKKHKSLRKLKKCGKMEVWPKSLRCGLGAMVACWGKQI